MDNFEELNSLLQENGYYNDDNFYKKLFYQIDCIEDFENFLQLYGITEDIFIKQRRQVSIIFYFIFIKI